MTELSLTSAGTRIQRQGSAFPFTFRPRMSQPRPWGRRASPAPRHESSRGSAIATISNAGGGVPRLRDDIARVQELGPAASDRHRQSHLPRSHPERARQRRPSDALAGARLVCRQGRPPARLETADGPLRGLLGEPGALGQAVPIQGGWPATVSGGVPVEDGEQRAEEGGSSGGYGLGRMRTDLLVV